MGTPRKSGKKLLAFINDLHSDYGTFIGVVGSQGEAEQAAVEWADEHGLEDCELRLTVVEFSSADLFELSFNKPSFKKISTL